MLDTYDDTAAMAESASEQGAPAADHAAEQQAPDMVRSAFENLESVVTHNLGHPDERMNLAASDARVLLEDFVAGSPASIPPTAEDGRIKTFTEMSDDEIMARLPDYLASGVNSSGINIGTIEEAQAIMAEAFMSEEELEESPDPKSPKGRAARERKLLDAAREAHEDMNERMAAHQKKWDEDMHMIGDREYSGAQLHAMHEWLSDDKNAESFEQELMEREGISKEEAKKRRMNAQEYLKMLEKERNGEQLTEEEKRRKKELEGQPSFSKDMHTLSDKVNSQGSNYGYKVSSQETGQQTAETEQSVKSRTDTTLNLGRDEGTTVAAVTPIAVSSAKVQSDDLLAPLIKAQPLKAEFQKADASAVPLEGAKQQPAVQVYAQNTVSSPQMEGATF